MNIFPSLYCEQVRLNRARLNIYHWQTLADGLWLTRFLKILLYLSLQEQISDCRHDSDLTSNSSLNIITGSVLAGTVRQKSHAFSLYEFLFYTQRVFIEDCLCFFVFFFSHFSVYTRKQCWYADSGLGHRLCWLWHRSWWVYRPQDRHTDLSQWP